MLAFSDGVCLSFSRDASAFLQVFFAGFRLGNPVIYLCADCSVSGFSCTPPRD